MVPTRVSNAARPITTPRVPSSSLWHRWTTDTGGSWRYRSMVATALRAAEAASPPCPRASTTTATSPPSGEAFTSERSPEVVSPGRARAATPHSSGAGASWTLPNAASPLLHGHRGACARAGVDVEFVHEAPRARKPEPEAAGGRVAVLQGPGDIGDARPLINRHHFQAGSIAVGQQAERDLAPLGVHHDVARDLRNGGRDHGLVAFGESGLRRQLAPLLTRTDDVHVGRDG